MSVVLIAGVFDCFHEGHDYLLSEAAKYGDLHVLVDNDDAVRKKKGKGRPKDSHRKRMFNVLKSGHPKCVSINTEDNPLWKVLQLKPDYLAVGDDYTEDQIVGLKEGKEWGCKPLIIKRIKGISTTKILGDKK